MGTYDTKGGAPINPDDDEQPCQICHLDAYECTCPECFICGVAGDPACINTHMPWKNWSHFTGEKSIGKEDVKGFVHKYKFHVESSRMTDITEEYTIVWDSEIVPPDVIKDYLEAWCEDVFPMFHFTDAFVTYRYDEIKDDQKTP